MQTLIDEGKIGEFDHLEELADKSNGGSGSTDAQVRRDLDPSRNT